MVGHLNLNSYNQIHLNFFAVGKKWNFNPQLTEILFSVCIRKESSNLSKNSFLPFCAIELFLCTKNHHVFSTSMSNVTRFKR